MSITRRLFLARLAGGGTLAVISGAGARALAPTPRAFVSREAAFAARGSAVTPAPVVTFFDGQLWLDTSGTSAPYVGPVAARSAAPIANLTEHDLSSLYGRL